MDDGEAGGEKNAEGKKEVAMWSVQKLRNRADIRNLSLDLAHSRPPSDLHVLV